MTNYVGREKAKKKIQVSQRQSASSFWNIGAGNMLRHRKAQRIIRELQCFSYVLAHLLNVFLLFFSATQSDRCCNWVYVFFRVSLGHC